MTITIEDISRLVTIELPGPLGIKGMESLLGYVAKNMPADINYNISHFADLRNSYVLGKKGLYKRKLSRTVGTLTVIGTIRGLLRDNPMAFDTFQTQPAERQEGMVKSIEFMLVPGWDAKDYRKEVVQLWDDVRQRVASYFGERK